ncbi:DUF3152 domain-containing protein [Actinomadura rupiterrae]|uniref:DUF3152 domain-containing protein n=1 Tax=Actinomadura rupiterrae TaxID=559627 RepID=UPI0020A4CABE|nr:DUF3152 domain-containing protein [Actinomadura rupiterrae]MCP2335894.1 hypothetical protein [Actinomadura rupiterrae]
MEPPRPRRGRRDPYPPQNPYGQQPYEQSPYGPRYDEPRYDEPQYDEPRYDEPRYDEARPEQYPPQQQPPQQQPPQPRHAQRSPQPQQPYQAQQPPPQQPGRHHAQQPGGPLSAQPPGQPPAPQQAPPQQAPPQQPYGGDGFFDDEPPEANGAFLPDGTYDPTGRVGRPVLDERLSADLDRDFAGADRGRTATYVLGIGALVLIAGTGIAAMVGATTLSGGKPPKPQLEPQVVPTMGAKPGDVPADPPTVAPAHPPFIPDHGTGKFTRAEGETTAVGRGKVRRYAVEVEGGTKQSASTFAHYVDRILTDSRGWTASGKVAFKRVGTGQQADFVVRLASPETTDKLCATHGVMTAGRGNCSSDKEVVVNLKRWLLTTTYYQGQTGSYRAQMVNFEVGRLLHYTRMGCPSSGKPAPVMMQQLGGLDGCRPNAWPYDRKGRFVSGPEVP